jgi:Cu2+-exporting ATPase
MAQHDAFKHLDDPAELAEIARELPERAGVGRRLETVLTIDGVHCAACVVAIEGVLRGSVDEVTVNAASRRARIVFSPDAQPLSGLFERIERLGYRPRPVSRSAIATAEAAGRRKSLWRMLVAVLCMMQVMMYAVPRYVAEPGDMPDDVVRLLMWAEWMLTLPVLLFASWPFFASAWRDLRAGRIGMDVPVTLGIVVTFVASSAAAASGGEVYFDSVVMFVAFLLIGRWLEASAREKALVGVGDLLARLPETVERLDHEGHGTTVTLRQLQAGDRVRVSVGQAVPADGIVESGRSHTDESLLTGESRPIAKAPGDPLSAGSLNLDGPLVLRLTRGPRQSRLQEIADLIESASARKPRLAQIADRWAGPFLVAVLLLAGLSWVAWQWIDPSRAIWVAASVLIVTCPCALSLATPTALITAAGSLARSGLLARSPQAIESLARVDTFVFDKTGTLTLDRLSLSDVRIMPRYPAGSDAPADAQGAARDKPAPVLDRAGALAAAAALEMGSLHPIAAALRRAVPSDATLPEVSDVREHGGAGISARIRLGDTWHDARLGSAHFAGAPEGGPAAVVLAIDGRTVAGFELAETLRPDAAASLDALRRDGASVEILSGDEPMRVAQVAALLGVSDFRAQASPEDKLALLEARQRQGRRVAMVGDGINDAPVLARADVSIAFATGAALAQHHADMLLLGGRLDAVVQARRLARRTMRIVLQNLSFAAIYNLVAVPLALAGLMPPWLAGLGMSASSLVVVLNALRLARPPLGSAAAPAPVAQAAGAG